MTQAWPMRSLNETAPRREHGQRWQWRVVTRWPGEDELFVDPAPTADAAVAQFRSTLGASPRAEVWVERRPVGDWEVWLF